MRQNGGDISAYTIKRLVSGEAHRFAGLNLLFAEVFGDDSYSVAKPGADYLEELLQKQHIIPLVAEVNGNVVAGLVAYVLDKFEQARSEIYIYDLAVHEAYRRRGIARNLILELKKHAQKAGAWVIYVQADKDEADLPARQLYASLGEQEDVFHYDIAVN